MEVEKTLQPGMDGTKRFVERYGKRLVCVRQRIDRAAGMRFTTVELVVSHRLASPRLAPDRKRHPVDLVPLRIAFREQGLREQVRAAGGRWDAAHRVWWLAADIVRQLQLEKRRA